MTEIGVHEAKTHLSKLLKRVEDGERFSITNRGKVVAVMVPPRDIAPDKSNDAYRQLLALRTKFPIGTVGEVTERIPFPFSCNRTDDRQTGFLIIIAS